MKPFMVFILLLLCSSLTWSQNSFKVIAVRGNVSTQRTAKLTIGQQVSVSDKITIASGGYLGLVHTNGRTVELKAAGSYPVRDLDAAATKKGGSVRSKFANYVVNELTETKDPIVFQDQHRANMRVTGAVERATGDQVNALDTVANAVGGLGEAQHLASVAYASVASSATILAIMPRTTRLMSDTVMFSWHADPKSTEYRVRIIGRNGKTIVERTTRDTTMQLDLAAIGLAAGELCHWHVERASDASLHSQEYGLFRLVGADRAATQAVLDDVQADLVDPTAAVSHLILASACEDQGLIYDAYQHFTMAVQAGPDVKNYKRMFAEFLRRQGLNMEAYEVYQ